MKVFFKVMGIILALGGLLLIVATPIAGILFTLFGVAVFVYGMKYQKKEKYTVSPVIPAKIAPKHRETIMVAGFDYHQRELKELMTERNFDYNASKKELIDGYDFDDRIYEYEVEECSLHIEAEPDNPHDPNAVKVFANDVFIGYVPRGRFPDIVEMMKHNPDCSVEIFGGRYKYLEYDQESDYLGTLDPKYFRVSVDDSPLKACMVFEW